MPISEVFNEDCMLGMARFPDKFFELAIVDPPYGISQPAFRKESKNKVAKTKNYHNAVYKQTAPTEDYFKELKRISKNQIVWGGNYYNGFLEPGKKWIFWDKGTEKTQWGDGELAYTSFIGAIKKFKYTWNGMLQENMKNKETRIHPTQKPIALYLWLLNNFAKSGNKIIDTHMGSQSSRIACYRLGFDYWGWEIDKEYFEDGNKRFNQQIAQLKLFNNE